VKNCADNALVKAMSLARDIQYPSNFVEEKVTSSSGANCRVKLLSGTTMQQTNTPLRDSSLVLYIPAEKFYFLSRNKMRSNTKNLHQTEWVDYAVSGDGACW